MKSVADTTCGRKPTVEDEANARLIAASPEMLSALELMVYERKIGMTSERSMQLAEAAIRRAKGE
jgi:hypothetical protein